MLMVSGCCVADVAAAVLWGEGIPWLMGVAPATGAPSFGAVVYASCYCTNEHTGDDQFNFHMEMRQPRTTWETWKARDDVGRPGTTWDDLGRLGHVTTCNHLGLGLLKSNYTHTNAFYSYMDVYL